MGTVGVSDQEQGGQEEVHTMHPFGLVSTNYYEDWWWLLPTPGNNSHWWRDNIVHYIPTPAAIIRLQQHRKVQLENFKDYNENVSLSLFFFDCIM